MGTNSKDLFPFVFLHGEDIILIILSFDCNIRKILVPCGNQS